MNSALQNRLVGTIIVVALVVILLPEVLDGEKSESSLDFVDIPPAPSAIVVEPADEFPQQTLEDKALRPAEVIDEVALDDESADEIAQANNSDSNNTASQAQATAAKPVLGQRASTSAANSDNSQSATEEPEVEIDVKDSGWVVQLGSFRYEKNVNELIAQLKQAGYRAYSRPVKTSVGVLNKVFVGPELERDKLEQALPHLQELTNLKGKITAFEVSAE
jgi:DedD protein